MSLEHHELENAGVRKSLAEWGVTSCVVTMELGGRDTMTLEVPRDIDDGEVWDPFSTVTLYDPEGNRRFKGIVVRPPRVASAAGELRRYTVAGPWQLLEWITWKQISLFAADPFSASSTRGAAYVSRCILNRSVGGTLDAPIGVALSIADQIEQILEYAVEVKSANIAYSIANLPTTVRAPENQVLDMRCSDALLAELEWCPHIGMRWNYLPSTPALQFGDVVDGADWGTRTLQVTDCEEWQGEPRYDLLTPRVRVDYIGTNQAENVQWLTLTTDESTIANGAAGAEEMTVVLRGAVWNGSTFTAPEEIPPAGLAASLHKAYAKLYYDLTWTTIEAEVSWAPKVGEQWQVSGAGAGFSSAEAVCQVITRDIGNGTTTFRAGPPAHLGLGARLDLLRANRLRQVPKIAGQQTYGMKGPEEGAAGGLAELEQVHFSLNGVAKEATFYVKAGTVADL